VRLGFLNVPSADMSANVSLNRLASEDGPHSECAAHRLIYSVFGQSFMTKFSMMIGAALVFSNAAIGAAIDDVQLRVGEEQCQGFPASAQSHVVYASNSSSTHPITARFKYDSVPSKQHFILFDAALNPGTDRFPKAISRRLAPLETVSIGCNLTMRAALRIQDSQTVPLVFTKDTAAYVDKSDVEARLQDDRSYLSFYLQNGAGGCSAGSRPPGLFYAVNLHSFARLSGSVELLDERGTKTGTLVLDLAPLSSMKVGCSNGSPKLGGVNSVGLALPEVLSTNRPAPAPLAVTRELPAETSQPLSSQQPAQLVPLPLERIQRTQNVCAGPIPAGWIKINDSWNPTVCGKPTSIIYNVWVLQQLAELPVGSIVYACSSAPPAGWALVALMWNPTVCGHPAAQQSNVMAIERSN
jgi:hypothetical protein